MDQAKAAGRPIDKLSLKLIQDIHQQVALCVTCVDMRKRA
jgi:hypothetical protein